MQVVPIHDVEPQGRWLAFDLADIVATLHLERRGLLWRIRLLDALGYDIEPLHEQVWQARPTGLWLSTADFVDWAHRFMQDIDGDFWGYTNTPTRQRLLEAGRTIPVPPSANARLEIRAIDSSEFIVGTRRYGDIAALRRRFTDVRTEDPTHWFR